MAFESTQTCIGHQNATADLSAKQYYAVFFDTSGGVSLAAAAKNADGFLQNKPTATQPAQVATNGVTKAIVNATVTAGQLLEVDTGGVLKPIASGTAVAKALEGSGTISSGTAAIAVYILKSNAVYA